MAYFNHAFKKTFVMNTYLDNAAITAAGGATTDLGAGELAFFNTETWAPYVLGDCCQFTVTAGTYRLNAPGTDRIGPFHGGYQETNKSKGVNPRYVTKIWNALSNDAQPWITHIGSTAFTIVAGTADCCPQFLCGETYSLRIDVKGDPVLRTLNHQGYVEVTADAGCCAAGVVVPTPVSPGVIMTQWAQQIWDSVVVTGNGPNGRVNPEPFMIPVITLADAASVAAGEIDTLLYPPGTAAAVILAGRTAAAAHTGQALGTIAGATWDTWVDPGYTAGDCAGISLVGAYVDTQFGDCTFQPSDWYNKEPIRIYASEVDLNGDPCAFTGICIQVECHGRQANGLGETAARDLIMSESYRQNFLATDLRIREVTQGNLMLGTGAGQIDRTISYDRLMIMHSIPRYNNPTGTFDNDQYILEILTPATAAGVAQRDLLVADLADMASGGAADCMLPCIDGIREDPVPCDAASVVVVA